MGNTIEKVAHKIDRDGVWSLLLEGPVWVVRRTQIAKRLRRLRLQVQYRSIEEPINAFTIDPCSIQFHLLKSKYTRRDCGELGRFDKKYDAGLVIPGNWDKYKAPIETEPIYRAYRRRIEEDIPWNKTEYGARIQRIYDRGGTRKGYPTLQDYFQSREELYEKITSEGYNPDLGRISINVGRNGELISNNDVRHRLAICRLAGVDQIPVEVVVRHERWQQIREEVKNTGSIEELTAQQVPSTDHPDLP